MPEHEEDLVASQTEGFKVGEKKTIEEYQNLGMCYLRWPTPSRAILYPSHSPW